MNAFWWPSVHDHREKKETHPAPEHPEAVVVEAQFLQGVAGLALEQLCEALHAVGSERVVAQVQLDELRFRQHHRVPQVPLRTGTKHVCFVRSEQVAPNFENAYRNTRTSDIYLTNACGISDLSLPVKMSPQCAR